jgi:hypothetical protein
MPITNWEITREDFALLTQVADRALRELTEYPDDKRTLVMDLNACHSNACPLDFVGLLAASLQDFSHDICGIRTHINRDTGKLDEGGPFMPRYALANHTGGVLAFCSKNPSHSWIIRGTVNLPVRCPACRSESMGTTAAAPKRDPRWISIDGEEYTDDEADLFLEKHLIERCTHEECQHHYHLLEGFTEADLRVALESEGVSPRRSTHKTGEELFQEIEEAMAGWTPNRQGQAAAKDRALSALEILRTHHRNLMAIQEMSGSWARISSDTTKGGA